MFKWNVFLTASLLLECNLISQTESNSLGLAPYPDIAAKLSICLLFNAHIHQGVLPKQTLCIQVGCQESALTIQCQSESNRGCQNALWENQNPSCMNDYKCPVAKTQSTKEDTLFICSYFRLSSLLVYYSVLLDSFDLRVKKQDVMSDNWTNSN